MFLQMLPLKDVAKFFVVPIFPNSSDQYRYLIQTKLSGFCSCKIFIRTQDLLGVYCELVYYKILMAVKAVFDFFALRLRETVSRK